MERLHEVIDHLADAADTLGIVIEPRLFRLRDGTSLFLDVHRRDVLPQLSKRDREAIAGYIEAVRRQITAEIQKRLTQIADACKALAMIQ